MITSRKLLWEHHIEFLSRDSGEPSKNEWCEHHTYNKKTAIRRLLKILKLV